MRSVVDNPTSKVWEAIMTSAPQGTAKIDWLTATVRSRERRLSLRETIDRIADVAEEAGVRRKDWRWLGYEGFAYEGVRWGNRPDSSIAVVSGLYAQALWPVFAQIPQNVSRLDIAFDHLFPFDYTPQMLETWQYWCDLKTADPTEKTEVTYIKNLNGGSTFYFGRRSAEKFVRVYDKGAQSGEMPAGKWWRHEIEFKRRMAWNRWLTITGGPDPLPLMNWHLRRSAEQNNLPKAFGELNTEAPPRLRLEAEDDQSVIRWLRAQVKPAIIKLDQSGRLEEAERALGFQLLLIPRDGEQGAEECHYGE